MLKFIVYGSYDRSKNLYGKQNIIKNIKVAPQLYKLMAAEVLEVEADSKVDVSTTASAALATPECILKLV